MIKSKFVRVELDLAPKRVLEGDAYRVWVNDTLMTERSWRWNDRYYIKENIQLEVTPGDYKITVTGVKPCKSKFVYNNLKVVHGQGEIIDQQTLRVT